MKVNPFGVNDITLCWHCGYAIQLRYHRWQDQETGEYFDGLFWDHFVLNEFTCHAAAPKTSLREAWVQEVKSQANTDGRWNTWGGDGVGP
jgi:hypothetical protein